MPAIEIPGLYLDKPSGRYRFQFRLAGKPYHKSLKTADRAKAEVMAMQVRETIHDLERGKKELPPDADLWQFLLSSGKRSAKLRVEKAMPLSGLWDWHFEKQVANARGEATGKEDKTLRTEHVHERHFLRILGKTTPLIAITGDDLQGYVNKRAKEQWNGTPIKPDTIGKEIDTLQMIWNRAYRFKLVPIECPSNGLQFPKKKERPSFQTWQEIERKIADHKLRPDEIRELWGSLFLTLAEIEEFLGFCEQKKTRSNYIFPMMLFIAHTGARLSEVIRSERQDFDFERRVVVIREKKRSKDSYTFRKVDMSARLASVMSAYFKKHFTGSRYTIQREADVQMQESTLHEAHEWFLQGSKWAVLKGYHILRHSFASNLALKGVDQRVIDELMGHQTEDMRKRYRHLFPEQRKSAVAELFGR